MVRKIHKRNIFYISLATFFLSLSSVASVFAVQTESDVMLELNIEEMLSVSVTNPTEWATGDINEFLRNKIVLNVVSNNAAGFTASMSSKNTTDLVNQLKSTATIPTLKTATTAGNFPTNYWGYSTDDTDAGDSAANYAALQTNAITIAKKTSPDTVNQDIFFGAKADATKDSGTYANTVVFSVVTGVITDEETPADPGQDEGGNTGGDVIANNPSKPNTPSAVTDDVAGGADDEIKGDLVETSPQGVTTTKVGSGTPLATGLAVTAGAAATAGVIFFILAKRKKDEEEEEETQN